MHRKLTDLNELRVQNKEEEEEVETQIKHLTDKVYLSRKRVKEAQIKAAD